MSIRAFEHSSNYRFNSPVPSLFRFNGLAQPALVLMRFRTSSHPFFMFKVLQPVNPRSQGII